MKVCKTCTKEKPYSLYYKHYTNGDGYCHECSECLNERTRLRKMRHRILINTIKMESGCVDCGYNKSPFALQFDHTADDKEFTIGASVTFSWQRIEKEIAKCEVVCANCHMIRTQERRGQNDFEET